MSRCSQRGNMVSGSIPSCDHTSVGVLAWRSGRLLLIERRKPPVGIAPPAGHVDQHGSFEAAAAAELFEETGLHSGRFDLLKSAAYRNPCRRPGGDWHHWRIYEATDLWGELHPSPSETKGDHIHGEQIARQEANSPNDEIREIDRQKRVNLKIPEEGGHDSV